MCVRVWRRCEFAYKQYVLLLLLLLLLKTYYFKYGRFTLAPPLSFPRFARAFLCCFWLQYDFTFAQHFYFHVLVSECLFSQWMFEPGSLSLLSHPFHFFIAFFYFYFTLFYKPTLMRMHIKLTYASLYVTYKHFLPIPAHTYTHSPGNNTYTHHSISISHTFQLQWK